MRSPFQWPGTALSLPQEIQTTYTVAQQGWLWSVAGFIEDVWGEASAGLIYARQI